jgi:dethiobiotin synthetase
MTGRLVVVSGTGTDIGKTHFAAALVRALGGAARRIAGIKPIESGVTDADSSDAARLRGVSSFHVKPFGYVFRDGLSPHLAARLAGEAIDLPGLVAGIAAVRAETDVTVVELAGGLFSPLSDRLVNADLARELHADALILVLPDRLGVLHDAIAAMRAADAASVRIDGLVFMAPAASDPSTGGNAKELQRLVSVPVLAELPRASVEALAGTEAVLGVARRVIGPSDA